MAASGRAPHGLPPILGILLSMSLDTQRLQRLQITAILFLLLLGGFLRLNGLSRIGLVGDELEDVGILTSILRAPNPFLDEQPGRDIAMDQARLPFYVTALACHASGRSDIEISRWVSVAWSVAALFAIFLLGQALFDWRTGAVACGLQAISIYDIGFSRFGLTTSSSIFVTWFLLSLLAFYRAVQTGHLRWYWLAGALIGLSMASKFFGLFTLVIITVWLCRWKAEGVHPEWRPIPRALPVHQLLLVNGFTLGALQCLASSALSATQQLTVFMFAVFLAMFLHAMIIRRRDVLANEPAAAILLLIWTLALVYFFIGSPAHIDIRRLVETSQWFDRWHQAPHVHTHLWDLLTVLFVRLNVPFQMLWVGAVAFSVARRRMPSHRLLLLAFAVPFAILSLSRWKVTWYLAMVFPICYLMIGAMVMEGIGRLRRFPRFLQGALAAGMLASLGWYGLQAAHLHPHYEIDGYKLGRAFIGWHQPAFVTFEGLPDAARWIDVHLPKGSDVAFHAIEHPVYNSYAYDHMLHYQKGKEVTYRLASAAEVTRWPYVLLSFASQDAEGRLLDEGYQPVHVFWLKQLRYAMLYAK